MTSVLGCHIREPSSPPNQGLDKAANPPQPPDLGRGANREEVDLHYSVFVGKGVPSVCSGPSPYFTFDSSKPKQSEPTMQTLANCMIDGPLKGKNIQLIGHTDPRGSEQHNERLGLKRANDVKTYLVNQGVDGARIKTSSAGEDQSSDAPKDWPSDRRVQIQIEQ